MRRLARVADGGEVVVAEGVEAGAVPTTDTIRPPCAWDDTSAPHRRCSFAPTTLILQCIPFFFVLCAVVHFYIKLMVLKFFLCFIRQLVVGYK